MTLCFLVSVVTLYVFFCGLLYPIFLIFVLFIGDFTV